MEPQTNAWGNTIPSFIDVQNQWKFILLFFLIMVCGRKKIANRPSIENTPLLTSLCHNYVLPFSSQKQQAHSRWTGPGYKPCKMLSVNVEQLSQMCPNSDFKTWPNLDLRCVPKLGTSKIRVQTQTSRYVPKLWHQRCVQTQTLRCVPKLRLPTCVRNQNSRGVQIQTSRCVPKLRLPRYVWIQNSRYVQIQTSRCVQIQISRCVQIQTSKCAQTLTSKCVQTQVYWMHKSWKLKCGGLSQRQPHQSNTFLNSHAHTHTSREQ